MSNCPIRSRHATRWSRVLLLVLVLATALPARADSLQERRVKAGARLFRALLAADLAIDTKAETSGDLLVLVVFRTDQDLARTAHELIAPHTEVVRINDRTVRAEVVRVDDLEHYSRHTLAGLFLADDPGRDSLRKTVEFSRQRHIVLFSPFEGHVQSGVAAGLVVEARVRPFLNTAALREARVELKPIFMKVAKVSQ